MALLFPGILFAEDISLALEKAPIQTDDVASIKRGAKFFATNCLSCHTLVYLRYDVIAKEAGITYEKMPLNVKQWPLGIKPPDLSLEANYRGIDWIYTYLHSFYLDASRPTGVNNLLVPNTAMSGILLPLMGQQIKLTNLEKMTGKFNHKLQWYDVLVLQQQGTMTPAQFDATMGDVVNFLNYAANPYQIKQHKLGVWVMGFFIILFILLCWLKHDYWTDVSKRKKN
jgi:ubiquinol-cytochrome c reductase cytochrome c1 subunit